MIPASDRDGQPADLKIFSMEKEPKKKPIWKFSQLKKNQEKAFFKSTRSLFGFHRVSLSDGLSFIWLLDDTTLATLKFQ